MVTRECMETECVDPLVALQGIYESTAMCRWCVVFVDTCCHRVAPRSPLFLVCYRLISPSVDTHVFATGGELRVAPCGAQGAPPCCGDCLPPAAPRPLRVDITLHSSGAGGFPSPCVKQGDLSAEKRCTECCSHPAVHHRHSLDRPTLLLVLRRSGEN